MFYNLLIESLCFSGSVLLGYFLQTCFSVFIPLLCDTGSLEGAGVRIFPSSKLVGFGKYTEEIHLGLYFQIYTFS